jgi:hypothetical protein
MRLELRLWQTGFTMLGKWWEHLRGYDKWTPAVATVQSTALSRIGEVGGGKSKPPLAAGWESICTIQWQDQDQKQYTAAFRAFEESPLYQLCEGDTVDIRFNPAKPSEYYLRGLIEARLDRTWKLSVYMLMLIVLGIAFMTILLLH